MRNPIQDYLESIVDQCAGTFGEVASYIPDLAEADPNTMAVCLATVDGHLYEVGSTELKYSIQSISKPFTYALALADRGPSAVAEKVDVEPSGEAFNEISLASDTGRPRNPMINAGAITTASLVLGDDAEERFERVREWHSRFAGRELEVSESIYRSEISTAHRNRAIAHMLREFDIIESDPEPYLDQYIRQCSIEVDTRDLALMAATLANGGVNPRTGERVVDNKLVERVLSVMTTCGMYDAAGDWVSSVGMPAKSGVSGGIIAVLPGQVGLAVFSPPLDPHGNSSLGVAVCERMSRDMEMHLMHVSRTARTAVKSSYSLLELPLRRRRTIDEQELLDQYADRCRFYELHGDLLFAGAESVVRTIVDDNPEIAVIDVRRVDEIATVARQTLRGLRDRLRDAGGEAVLVDPEGTFPDPDKDTDLEVPVFDTRANAAEWCEDELLRRHGSGPEGGGEKIAQHHPLLQDISDKTRERVLAKLKSVSYQPGDVVLAAGGKFAGVHIIVHGRAQAFSRKPDGELSPLVTMGPGTSFGELALGTNDIQETQISAKSELELLVLTTDDIVGLTEEDPAVGVDIWRAIARDGYRVADRALRERVSGGTSS